MTRVVVVSGNPAIGMGLVSAGYEVVDMRPADTDAWAGAVADAPVLVLDVDDPVLALDSVDIARRARAGVEIVLVSSDRPGWPSIEAADIQRLHVVPLPMTLPNLVRAVTEACVPSQRSASTDGTDGTAGALPAATVSPAGPAAPAPLAPPPEPTVEPPPAPYESQTAAPADPAEPASRRFALRRGGRVRRQPQAGGPVQPTPLMHAVRRVLAGAASLPTVDALATALAVRIGELVGAPATAVLLPDGDVWRVAGGAALRPLETRLLLHGDAWLVQHVAVSEHGLLVEDTDVVRQPLSGVPLAHRRHLLAAPLPAVSGIVVAGRDGGPFAEADLQAAAAEADRHAWALRDACEVRALARALADHLDDGYGG